MDKLRYPVGTYTPIKAPSDARLTDWINTIKVFPEHIRSLTTGLTAEQKNWRYRPEGWNIRQVVHHCADSHMNAMIRFKLALTENKPTIKPYEEAKWAVLPDSMIDELDDSLLILEGVHRKWSLLLSKLTEAQLKLEYIHPEHGKSFNLAETIGTYAWHSRHHEAHIRNALAAKGAYN